MNNRRNFIKVTVASVVATLLALRDPSRADGAAVVPGLKIPIADFGKKVYLVTPTGKQHLALIWSAMLMFKKLKVGDDRLIGLPFVDALNFPEVRRNLLVYVFRTKADLSVRPIFEFDQNIEQFWKVEYKRSELLRDNPEFQNLKPE